MYIIYKKHASRSDMYKYIYIYICIRLPRGFFFFLIFRSYGKEFEGGACLFVLFFQAPSEGREKKTIGFADKNENENENENANANENYPIFSFLLFVCCLFFFLAEAALIKLVFSCFLI